MGVVKNWCLVLAQNKILKIFFFKKMNKNHLGFAQFSIFSQKFFWVFRFSAFFFTLLALSKFYKRTTSTRDSLGVWQHRSHCLAPIGLCRRAAKSAHQAEFSNTFLIVVSLLFCLFHLQLGNFYDFYDKFIVQHLVKYSFFIWNNMWNLTIENMFCKC